MYQRAGTSSGGGGGNVDVGTIPYGTGWTGSGATSTYKVTCGFKPKKICWYIDNAAAQTNYFWVNNVYEICVENLYKSVASLQKWFYICYQSLQLVQR